MTSLKLKFVASILSLISLGNIAQAADPIAPSKSFKPCPQTRGTDLIFPKKHKFEILSYEKVTRSFVAVSSTLPDEGEFRVTLAALADSVRRIKKDYDAISHNPSSIVGNTYVTQADLMTLTDPELEARRGCGK